LTETQKDIDKQADSFGKSFGRFFTAAAVSKAVGVLGDMVQAARDEEAGIARLAGAVDNAGVSWADYGDKIERIIAARGRLAFSDDQLRDSLASLTTSTGSITKALKLQLLAIDVARGRHIDLATASDLVGKAANGQIGALRRVGIAISANATAEQALALLQAKYASAGERYAATSQGAADRLANAWGNVQEIVGGAIGGVLPIIASGATIWAGFGKEIHIAAGAVAVFAKAGKGSIPILTGLRKGIVALGMGMKAMFLSPIGLAIAAIAILVIGLKLLYDRSENFRKIVHKVGEALMLVFGPILRAGGAVLGWLGDRLGDVAKALGIVGDEADENLGEDIPDAAAAAVNAIKSIGEQTDALRDKFKPAGVDATADFLATLGVDQAAINKVLDTIYDTVGADTQTRFRKITDQAYARIQKEARDAIFAEADAMAEIVEDGGNALNEAAKEAGLTQAQYVERAKQKTAEAQARLELWTKGVKSAIDQARALGQSELAAMDRMRLHVDKVHDIRDAWNEARDASQRYYSGILGGAPFTPPSRWDREERPMPPPAAGGGGDVYLTQNNTLPEGSTQEIAAAVQSSTLDGITEAFRQQARRLAYA
ncbi:MAG TPA: hypothetical protein VGR85_03135, partial [Candidatus Limnocylindria bacterium]|nr:hypothetical protein [Candidatus Limnocylindria bacterium]